MKNKCIGLTTEGQAHAVRVAARVPAYRLVALLHDVLEDTETTAAKLRTLYGPDVARSVSVLTRRFEETYFQYILRVRESADRAAIAVKAADLRDHLDRTATLKASLKPRYEKALILLLTGAYDPLTR